MFFQDSAAIHRGAADLESGSDQPGEQCTSKGLNADEQWNYSSNVASHVMHGLQRMAR